MSKVLVGVGLAVCGVSAILAGCNGVNGVNGGPIPVPTSTFPVPTSTPASQSFSAPVTLANGQTGTLALRLQNGRATGTLKVDSRRVADAVARLAVISLVIPSGTYPISGTFTPPRGFSVSGSFPAPIGSFSISGTIPTPTQTGAFTLRAAGQSTNGIIPVIGTVPTPIPQPTTAGTPSGTPLPTVRGTLNVTFSNSTINASSAPFNGPAANGFIGIPSSPKGNFLGVYGTGVGTAAFRSFTVNVLNTISGGGYSPFTVGQSFGFGSNGINLPGQAAINYSTTVGVRAAIFSATSGTLTITAVSANSISYKLQNVHLGPGIVNPGGTGSFTLNGTGTLSK